MLAALLKTLMPLYSVFELMVEISVMMLEYSACVAACCAAFNVPLEASVASVTARFNKLVTCESAPSATCRKSTPSDAFFADCDSAVAEAVRPLASESPAASSAPELMREPD